MAEELWSFAKKRDSVWVTYFKHRSFHKYTRVARGQDRVEPKEEKRILDINVSWGRGMGFSDHY